MINGGHVIIYSKNAEADKAFIKNVLKFPYVDVSIKRGQIYFLHKKGTDLFSAL